jgi:hypothetical protein
VVAYPTWLTFFLSLDLGLLVAELFVLCLLVFILPRAANFRLRRRSGYDDFVTFCQTNSISLAEFGAITTMALGLVCFDFFLAFTEEDPTEIFSFFILVVVLAGGAGLIVAADIQYFYMAGSQGIGNAFLAAFSDLLANVLCLVRVFMCWVRFIFYDFQVEALDLSFHYAGDLGGVGLGSL